MCVCVCVCVCEREVSTHPEEVVVEGGGLSRGTLLSSASTAGVGVATEEMGVVLTAGVDAREVGRLLVVFASAGEGGTVGGAWRER